MRPVLSRFTGIAFIAAAFLSALLLFSVQPMFTKMVLPKLGGSPSVWAVSMCFFQAALLLGYCYAFALSRLASGVVPVALHTAFLVLACLALPVALPQGRIGQVGDGTYLWLVAVLAAGVGLPFLALSANAPLLQSWLTHTGSADAKDPYFLYVASNAGSLAALIAYPVAIEPWLTLRAQSAAWSGGFVLLGLLVVTCGALMVGTMRDRSLAAGGHIGSGEAGAEPIAWRDRLMWIGLAFVPSGLLVAFTTFLATDIASAPFLWVVPLAVYLATFIVVFRPVLPLPERWLELAQPILVAVAIVSQSGLARLSLGADSAIGLLAFVTTCLVCHRKLYLARPAAAHLTEFYVWMSLGGVLGGMFSALVAPQVFSTTIEYPLLLALGLGWQVGALAPRRRYDLVGIAIALAVALALALALARGWAGRAGDLPLAIRLAIVAVLVVVMTATVRSIRLQLTVVALTTVLVIAALGRGLDYSGRSFFGVHRVQERGDFRVLLHGTTIHGAQRLRAPDGRPLDPSRPPPTSTYYHPASPPVLGLELMRAAMKDGSRPPSVGIIGLGVGTMACHATPGSHWRFFEIDPIVVEIARNPALFRFLSSCKPDAEIVVGDARLTLAGLAPGSLDYLLVDAFSSDAIPMHLLTVGAFELYFEKLSDRGVLALHLSNSHLDLVDVAAASVAAIPGLHALYVESPGETMDAYATRSVLVARHRSVLAPATGRPDTVPLAPVAARPWTDDYSDIFSALVRSYRNSLMSPEDRAIEIYSAAVARYPGAESVYRQRAEVYAMKKNYPAAIADLTAAIRISPDNIDYYRARGFMHQFNDNDAAAIEDLSVYLKTRIDSAALELRGIAYGNTGQRDKAIADLRKVLLINPRSERTRQLLERLGASP